MYQPSLTMLDADPFQAWFTYHAPGMMFAILLALIVALAVKACMK